MIMKHFQTSDMKGVILFFLAVLTAVFSNAQVTVVKCAEEDYNQAVQSLILCSCIDLSTDLSQTESRQIDSLLHQQYFVTEGFNEADFDLEWKMVPFQHAQAAYIVEFRLINKKLDATVDTKIAFIDSLFRSLGAINGGLMATDCCIHQIATREINHLSTPPFLYLYRWKPDEPIPELIDQYVPMDLHILEYCYSITGELFVKCKDFHASGSDLVFVKVSIK